MRTSHHLFSRKSAAAKLKTVFAALLGALALASGTAAQTYNLKNKSVDLRPQISEFNLPIKSQAPRPTCSIFASTFLLEFMTAKGKNLKNADFSEEYLNAMANRSTGKNDDGGFFSDALEGYEEFGIVNESQAAYKSKFDAGYLMGSDKPTMDLLKTGETARFLEGDVIVSPNVAAKNEPGLTDEQFYSLLRSLDDGIPVAVGHSGTDAANLQTTKLNNNFTAFNDFDLKKASYAHSVPIVGYVADQQYPGGGYLIFRNSYGANWGDKGYGYMTFNYAKKFTYDILIFKNVQQRIALPQKAIENRFLLRKDILRPITIARGRITLPFLDEVKSQQLDLKIKQK